MAGQNVAPATRRGRPRNTGLDEAIRKATWELLSETGYEGLTFDAVATRAGCTRPAIYRRFPNKRELVMTALRESVRDFEPGWDTEPDARSELIAHLQGFVDYLAAGGNGIILALAHARRTDPELSAELNALVENDRHYYFRALRRAASTPVSDELCAILVDSLLGTVIYRCTLSLGRISDEELAILVDQVVAAASSR